MAKGFWIAHIDITDAEGYKAYVPMSLAAITAHGGKFLARGGTAVVREGAARLRTVIVEFPTFERALACYRSPEYECARALRNAYASSDLVIVEGVVD
jgi:uncharacterized protein (DUF1330 family)